MKILILDIETTGLKPEEHAIVEVGMVLIDTDTRQKEIVYDKIVRETVFDPETTKDAWVFEHTSLTHEEAVNGVPFEECREEIQALFNKYPVTAYNKKFDLGFFGHRGFTFTERECLMEKCTKYSDNFDKYGKQRWPKAEAIYNKFFPESNYVEAHRGADDAWHEADIAFKLIDIHIEERNEIKLRNYCYINGLTYVEKDQILTEQ